MADQAMHSRETDKTANEKRGEENYYFVGILFKSPNGANEISQRRCNARRLMILKIIRFNLLLIHDAFNP